MVIFHLVFSYDEMRPECYGIGRRKGVFDMEENRTRKTAAQNIYIEDREKVTVTGVTDVEHFNEETILLTIQGGGLIIKGQKLHVQKLDLEDGKVIITGFACSAAYTEKKDRQEKGFLKRILK